MDGVFSVGHRSPRRSSSVVEDREVELVEAVVRSEHVDVDDLAVTDREVPGDLGTSAHRPYEPDGAVDERSLAGDGGSAPNFLRRAHSHGGGVGDEHDVRVEQGHERVEVTAARGGEEGVDD